MDVLLQVLVIHSADNDHFKVCESHAGDHVSCKSHTQGTYVQLDKSSTDTLVHHFQSLYGATDLFELKGWQITKYYVAISNNVREVLKRPLGQPKRYKDHCFAVILYCMLLYHFTL